MPKHFFPELPPPPPPPSRRKKKGLPTLKSETSPLPADRAVLRSGSTHQGQSTSRITVNTTWSNETAAVCRSTNIHDTSSSDTRADGNTVPSRKGGERRQSTDQPPSTKKANIVHGRWPRTKEHTSETVVFESFPVPTCKQEDAIGSFESYESRLSDVPDPEYKSEKNRDEKTALSASSLRAPIKNSEDSSDSLSNDVLKTSNQNNQVTSTSRRAGLLVAASKKKAASSAKKLVEEEPTAHRKITSKTPNKAISTRATQAAERIRQRLKQGTKPTKTSEETAPSTKSPQNTVPQQKMQKESVENCLAVRTVKYRMKAKPVVSPVHPSSQFFSRPVECRTKAATHKRISSVSHSVPPDTESVKGSEKKQFSSFGSTLFEPTNQTTQSAMITTHAPNCSGITMKKFETSIQSQESTDIESSVSVHLISSESLSLSSLGSDIGRIRSILSRNRSGADNVHLVEAMECDFPIYSGTSIDPMERASFRLLSTMIVPIQCMVRRYLAKRTALTRLWAVLTIQACARGSLVRLHVRDLNRSANIVQACFRGNQARGQLAFESRCAAVIQSHIRGYLATMMRYETLGSATMIQCAFRKHLATQEARIRSVSLVMIQSVARGFLVREELLFEHLCATEIQRHVRGHLAKTDRYGTLLLVTMIQSVIRMHSASKIAQKRLLSAILIQATARQFLVRKGLKFKAEAATTIQAAFRRFVAYFTYQINRVDVITIQSLCRRKLANRKANLMRWKKAATLMQSGLEMMGVDCSFDVTSCDKSIQFEMPSQEMLVHIASLISSLRVQSE